jgi:drug/metabolite transporter (DMT)-like permease
MPVTAIALVLLAAGFHAGWNLLLHDTEDREAAMAVAGIATGVVLLPAMLIWPPWDAFALIVLAGVAHTLYALGLAAAYRRGMLAVAYPIARGTAPLLVTIGGWLVLAERPGLPATAGAALLCAGLALIANVGKAAAQGPAIGYAVLTGVAIASYSLVDARAVREVHPVGYLGAIFLLQGVLLTGWIRTTRPPIARPAKGIERRRWSSGHRAYMNRALRPGILIGGGSTIAYLLVVLALQRADAGRVTTLREVSILLGLALSRTAFSRKAWAGAACVVLGVVLATL